MRIHVEKNVGSSRISLHVKDEEKLEKVQAIAEKLFDRLPEPAFNANREGLSIIAGIPMPLFDRDGEE